MYIISNEKTKIEENLKNLSVEPPKVLQPLFETNPQQLKSIPNWVLWQYAYRADQSKPWTNTSLIVMKNGFVCTTNILLFAKGGLTSLIVLLLLSLKLLKCPPLVNHHHLSLGVLNGK